MKNIILIFILIYSFLQAGDYEDGLQAYHNKKYNEALKYFNKASEQNNILAKGMLASMYRQGIGMDKNITKAIKIYEELANDNIIEAQEILGTIYRSGIDVDINYDKAIKLFTMASKQGSSKALFQLGTLYYAGKGVRKNIKKAIKFYDEAAKKDNKKAQFNLGNIYRMGTDVPEDAKKAFQYYKKSSKQDFIPAQFNLARMYKEGIGTKKNYKKAFELFEKLSKKGMENAQYRLGNMYYHGYGVKQNYKKAIYMWEKANTGKCLKAKKSLEKFNEEHQGFYKDEENFLKEFQIFYAKNTSLFQNKHFTFQNSDTNKTIKKAEKIFKKILFQYQKIDNLFPSKLFLANMNKKDISTDLWLKFVNLSEKYLKYTKEKNLLQNIGEKHLKNVKSLMENSTTILDYMISLVVYKKIYTNYHINNKLLREYKPLTDKIFFIKLKNEEDRIIQTVKVLGESFLQKNQIKSNQYNQAMKKIIDSATKYNRKYFQQIKVAIKNHSLESIKKIGKLLEKDKENFLSSKKDTYSLAGKLFVLLLINPVSYYQSYDKHHQLIKVYQELLIKSLKVINNK